MRRWFSEHLFFEPAQKQIPSQEGEFLRKVKDTLEQHLENDKFGVGDLAYEMGFCERQLRRKIKSLTGKGPAAFIRAFRLAYAANLLQKKAGTVSEIAHKTGFKRSQHFSQAFKAHFGTSPSTYSKGSGTKEATPDLETQEHSA